MPLKVLIIDNDESILEVMEIIITAAGYTVVRLNSMCSISEINEIMPDAIFIEDQWCGEKKGRIICGNLKESLLTFSIPVFLMSTESKADQLLQESKADQILIKPFSIESVEMLLYTYI